MLTFLLKVAPVRISGCFIVVLSICISMFRVAFERSIVHVVQPFKSLLVGELWMCFKSF